jgi:glucokinase
MYTIGVDLGGTNIKVGVVDEHGNIVGRADRKTNLPRPAESIVESIAETVKDACVNAGITIEQAENIGIGTPGAADRKTGVVLYSNNLGFNNTPLGPMLKEVLKHEVYVENDANAAAYGEFIAGAGKGYSDILVITLGTGVGSGIIIDGKIFTGSNCCGAEIGHMVIEYNGAACSCGRKGCFEAYSSATALIRMTKDAMNRNPESEMWKIAKSIELVNGKTAFDGMRAGDQTAKEVVQEYIERLGCGLVNVVNIFQPELLLLGGGICREGTTLTDPLKAIIERDCYCVNPEKATKLDTAKLGNDAGIIGAANLYRL